MNFKIFTAIFAFSMIWCVTIEVNGLSGHLCTLEHDSSKPLSSFEQQVLIELKKNDEAHILILFKQDCVTLLTEAEFQQLVSEPTEDVIKLTAVTTNPPNDAKALFEQKPSGDKLLKVEYGSVSVSVPATRSEISGLPFESMTQLIHYVRHMKTPGACETDFPVNVHCFKEGDFVQQFAFYPTNFPPRMSTSNLLTLIYKLCVKMGKVKDRDFVKQEFLPVTFSGGEVKTKKVETEKNYITSLNFEEMGTAIKSAKRADPVNNIELLQEFALEVLREDDSESVA